MHVLEQRRFAEDEVAEFRANARRCNAVLNSVHEGCGPCLTSSERAKMGLEAEYGGITGTVQPTSMSRLASVLMTGRLDETAEGVLADEFLLMRGESVFLDIGCGTGRPTCYFAHLQLKCSLGLDIDSLQVANSISGYGKITSTQITRPTAPPPWKCPVSFFKQDADTLQTLGPVTHAYAFVGYSDFVASIARLVLNSPKLRVMVLVVLKQDELYECGLMDDDDDDDEDDGGEVFTVSGMRMAGGHAYLGVVVPITPHRRAAIAEALSLCPTRSKPTFGKQMDQGEEDKVQMYMERALARGVHGGTDKLEGEEEDEEEDDDDGDGNGEGSWRRRRRLPLRACARTPSAETESSFPFSSPRKAASVKPPESPPPRKATITTTTTELQDPPPSKCIRLEEEEEDTPQKPAKGEATPPHKSPKVVLVVRVPPVVDQQSPTASAGSPMQALAVEEEEKKLQPPPPLKRRLFFTAPAKNLATQQPVRPPPPVALSCTGLEMESALIIDDY